METETTAPAIPSPWRTIWFSPRHTIRRIIDAEVRPSWVPVIALVVLHQAVTSLQREPLDGTLSVANSAMPVILGMLQVVFGVLVGPFLLALVGGWFGGEADADDIRQSVAWSYVPFAVAGLLVIPVVLAYGGSPDAADPHDSVTAPAIATLIAVLIILLAIVWTLVLQVITLAEVQRFSILRAIASMIILVIPLMLLAALT